MFKKIDCWIGRHMSKSRWIVLWSFNASVFLIIGILKGGCVGVLLCLMSIPAPILVWGNARRVL